MNNDWTKVISQCCYPAQWDDKRSVVYGKVAVMVFIVRRGLRKEVMQRWMLIKCFPAPVRTRINEGERMHSFLELNFRFGFAARVGWLTVAVRFHSITRTHTETRIYIDYWSLQPVEWSQCEVGERGRREEEHARARARRMRRVCARTRFLF